MKKFTVIVAVALFAIFITSCHKRSLRGEGATVSETRILGTFSKVEANGSTEVTIVKDSVYKAVVTGFGNLVPVYETKIKGDRLVLQYKEHLWNIRNDNIKVEIHTPYVDKVAVNGSANMGVGPGFEQEHFAADINGSGNIVVGKNEYGSITMDVNGSGDIHAEHASSKNAYCEISGSGNIHVFVTEFLKVRISGSGDVYYRGSPSSTDIDISGSGSVKKQN